MDYEWDERKCASNLDKHDVDFAAIRDFEWDTAVIDSNIRYGELRFVAFGYIGLRLHVVVYTLRGTAKRIISLRKASAREIRRYAGT